MTKHNISAQQRAWLVDQLDDWLATTGKPSVTLVTGDTIRLRVVPVDPRDLFRGDYVILNYELSSVPAQGIAGHHSTDLRGETIYVTIVPEHGGEHWRASQYSLIKPTTGKFLRGQFSGRNRIEFGIESYFVQEGEGLRYEQSARDGSPDQ